VRYNGGEVVGETDLHAPLAAADCVAALTDHSSYDWAAIRQRAKMIVDTWHVIS
jgi:UDP-N-acetyl-D-mannosaminuronate dehydrogenase